MTLKLNRILGSPAAADVLARLSCITGIFISVDLEKYYTVRVIGDNQMFPYRVFISDFKAFIPCFTKFLKITNTNNPYGLRRNYLRTIKISVH